MHSGTCVQASELGVEDPGTMDHESAAHSHPPVELHTSPIIDPVEEAIEEATDRRALILEAALLVISKRGVDGARLADVAEAAGVSLGLVQHYFRHRRRLVAEAFKTESARITRDWGRLVDPDSDPLTRLIEYLRLCTREGTDPSLRSFRHTWSLWLEFWSKANRDEEIRALVPDIYGAFTQLFTKAIIEGIDSGVFTLRGPTQDSADRIVSLIDGLAVRTLVDEMDQHRMLSLLVEGMCVELGVSEADFQHARRLCSHRQLENGY